MELDDRYEWVQEFDVTTEKRARLKLYLGYFEGGFKMTGELFEAGETISAPFEAPGPRVAQGRSLLESYLQAFNDFVVKNDDRIIQVRNPCRDEHVSGAEQHAIIHQLGLGATVVVE